MEHAHIHRLIGLAVGAFALASLGVTGGHAASASGSHDCKAPDGAVYKCWVTVETFGSCVEAWSSAQLRDCCPTSCPPGSQVRGSNSSCRGGTSIGFTQSICTERR